MKLSLAAMLAAAAVLLAACGGSSGLIPEGNAGPLRSDFEAVASAAENGNGKCASTEKAIEKTEADFAKLPSGVSSALRSRLSQGIEHLATQARVACTNPVGGGTSTSTQSSTTSSSTTTTTTTLTTASEELPPSSSTSTTSTSPPVGGAEAPNGGVEANPGGSPAEEGEQK